MSLRVQAAISRSAWRHRAQERGTPLRCYAMKLSSKGRFAEPPVLPKAAQLVSDALAAWPDVHARAHWLLGDENVVDGADFYLGEDEIGHIHLEGEAHVAVGPKLGAELVAARRAKPFRWSDDFVVLSIKTPRDAEAALSLFQLAYDRRREASERA